jgi:hypothetical protein
MVMVLFGNLQLLRKVDIIYHTVKKPSVTQDQNTRVTENSIIHVERSEKSVNTRDWASLSIGVTEFSVTLVLWSCVTLGFSNSAPSIYVISHNIRKKSGAAPAPSD